MARTTITLLLDPEFKAFLDYIKVKHGTPMSRTIEIATAERYKSEFAEYLQTNKKGADEQ